MNAIEFPAAEAPSSILAAIAVISALVSCLSAAAALTALL